jgi:hypothetical protein
MNKEEFEKLCLEWIERVRSGAKYAEYRWVELKIIEVCEQSNRDPDDVFAKLYEIANDKEEAVLGWSEDTIKQWAESSKEGKPVIVCVSCGCSFEIIEDAKQHKCPSDVITL